MGLQLFTFSVLTFGCRVNQADSLACERELTARGGVSAPPEAADLVVVNTCSVTAAADQGARQAIRGIARRNPRARIVATGCYATRSPEEVEGLPGVVQLVTNPGKERLARDLAAAWPALEGQSGEDAPVAFPRPGHRGRTSHPLQVQTGCDESCSYCTIPATRGPSRSRRPDEIVEEARALAAAGYKELVVTAVHLGAYGRDLAPPASLLELLRALSRLDADVTFRLSSLEPMDCPADLVRLVAGSGRFAPHFHLPLQHGSERLLRAMRRPYSLADYRALVASIRRVLPDAAIGCDVIVGFPGETREDHEVLAGYLRGSGLTHLHVFPYSDRPGTPASALPARVTAAVVRERCEELRAISGTLRAAFAARQVGLTREALTIEDGTRAVTDNYLKVSIPHGLPRNQRIRVRIVSAAPLLGEVVA